MTPPQSLASEVFPNFCLIVPLIPTAVSFVLLYLDSPEPWLDGLLAALHSERFLGRAFLLPLFTYAC